MSLASPCPILHFWKYTCMYIACMLKKYRLVLSNNQKDGGPPQMLMGISHTALSPGLQPLISCQHVCQRGVCLCARPRREADGAFSCRLIVASLQRRVLHGSEPNLCLLTLSGGAGYYVVGCIFFIVVVWVCCSGCVNNLWLNLGTALLWLLTCSCALKHLNCLFSICAVYLVLLKEHCCLRMTNY